LARDRQDQRPETFAIGEKVDARITAVDRVARRLSLTIKGE
jgi:small subunit ribosomal protein S1